MLFSYATALDRLEHQITGSRQRENTETISFEEELLAEYGSILDTITQEGYQGQLSSSLYELCYFLVFIEKIPHLPKKIKLELLEGLDLNTQEKVTGFVDFLLQTQKENGAWSSDQKVNYIKDEIMSTLVVIESFYLLYILPHKDLSEPTVHAHYSTERTEKIQESIKNAQIFLKSNFQAALRRNGEANLIAFEALAFQHLKEIIAMSADAGTKFDVAKNPILFPLLQSLIEGKLAHKIKAMPEGKSTLDSIFDAVHSYIEETPLYELVSRNTNGSMGIYPSSTIQYLRLISKHIEYPLDGSIFNNSEKLEHYVRESFKVSGQTLYSMLNSLLYLQRASSSGYFESFYPSKNFGIWWAAMYLSKYPVDGLGLALKSISRGIEEKIGVTENFLADVDTTSVQKIALQLSGQDIGLQEIVPVLWFYEGSPKKSFKCYEHEVRTSPSANIHALTSLCLYFKLCTGSSIPNGLGDYFLNPLKCVLESIDARSPFLQDKWHLSPFYTTGELILLLVETLSLEDKENISVQLESEIEEKLLIVIDYFAGSQNEDGGFCSDVTGYSNTEETCYAVSAILDVLDFNPEYLAKYEDLQVRLTKAYSFLREEYYKNRNIMEGEGRPKALSACPYPQLWIAKGLYCPIHIVEALEISTLLRLKSRVGSQLTEALLNEY